MDSRYLRAENTHKVENGLCSHLLAPPPVQKPLKLLNGLLPGGKGSPRAKDR